MFFSQAKEQASETVKASSPEYLALKSCIDRAISYIDEGDFNNAKLSFLSDIQKCNALKHLSENPLTQMIIMSTSDRKTLIDAMEGFYIDLTQFKPETKLTATAMHQTK